MGVPKFYRWISERYPCLSEVVKEFQIPEFDNLYLDMNGIIHVCSHPEDDNPHFRITEEKIFSDIMHYLEFLFRMIKPRKVFFMAVDGVAPRAKMNQQRGRRFRSAREAEELEKKAKEKGETLPTEKRFDSNCITPGTPFMVRLQEQLKYFVVKKLSTDPLWHGVRVFLSGHETPGEGEHKIMDFIRHERSQPGYDPNTRHCLYGLDADLMMLGLATHEPHFSLLREEVRFGGKRDKHKRPTTAEETTFHLLHLSLFREYLDFEYSALKETLPFPYNLENVIDDWVLMGFLVGNDFIPHLPNLHINHDALPLLWKTYIDVLPSCGGYINEGGRLNLERFEKYIVALSKFDFDTFSEQAGDLKWLEGKKGQSAADKAELISAARKFRKNVKKSENRFAALAGTSEELEDFMSEDVEDDLGMFDLSSPEENSEEILSDEDSGDTLDDEFRHHKRYYYMTKMDYQKVTPEVLKDQAEGYVRGLQWILLYYYEGVPSWSWFYPHHYAPYMSDVKDFKNMKIMFDIGRPFLPFEQLMAVLPAASKELLPQPFQSLMTMDSSPVIDFYPVQFDTDLNGKQQDWEAVVLIPFIEENRLLTAMKTKEHLLSAEEKGRNGHGPCLLYEYQPEPSGTYPSSLPDAFPDIAVNHSRLTKIAKDGFILPSNQLTKGLLPGAKLDVFYAGFPTLKHISHKAELRKEGVKVFQMNSRGFNTMLTIDEQETPDIRRVAKDYLGQEIFVGWPHLYEAKVVAVCDDTSSFSLKESKDAKGKKSNQPGKVEREDCDENTTNIWYREAHTIKEKYKDRLGVIIGGTDILIRALPMTGRKYVFGSHGRVTLEKQFGNRPVPFALQATVKDIAVHDSRFCQFKTLKEYLPEGSPVFMLGWPHYGCQGEVLEVDLESGRVRINLSIFEEPKLSVIINNQMLHAERYVLGYVGAQQLGISSNLVSRITGTILVAAGEKELAEQQQNPHKVNIGLNLKFTKRGEEVPGYTKMSDGQWSYSQKTIDIVREYLQKFPEMFESIARSDRNTSDIYYESQLIPKTCTYTLKDICEYIKSLPCSSLKPMKSGADIISEGTISALEDEAKRVVEINKKRQKRVKMQVKPHLLFRHVSSGGAVIPDCTTVYRLFDRVVNIRQGYAVPFGLRGTVVGIHPAEVEVNTVYEVIFDEEFMGGISIRNSSLRGYRMPPSSLLNLTHGERKNGVKPAQPLPDLNQQNYSVQYNRNMTGNRNYAEATAGGHGSNYQGRNQYNQGYDARNQFGFGNQDNRGGYHDNQRGHGRGQEDRDRYARNSFQPSNNRPGRDGHTPLRMNETTFNRKPQSSEMKEDLSGKVFNGGNTTGSQPTFVTPKLTRNSSGQLRQDTSSIPPQHAKGRPKGQEVPRKQSSGNDSEFANMWKQLQTANESDKGTSLSQAASVLPTIPSAGQLPATDTDANNSNAAQTKIDVDSLFSAASQSEVTTDTKDNKNKDNSTGTQSNSDTKEDLPTKPSSSKVVSNDEFAAMFKTLNEELVSNEEDEEEEEDVGDEGADMLKKMLRISSDEGEEGKPDQLATGGNPRVSYGRQVSLQELFDGAKQQQSTADFSKQQPNQQQQQQQQNLSHQQKRTKNYQKLKQQQQTSQEQQQQQGQFPDHQKGYPPPLMQQQVRPSLQKQRPPLMMSQNQGGNRNPVMELMSYCQSLQIGLPLYDYVPKSGLHYCIVTMSNGARFQGSMCKSREEAAESAAGVALLHVKGSMHQMPVHPMMRFPGYMPGVPPVTQGNQFSSPNSAFSPVSNFAGVYQGPGNQGQIQGYNQMSYNTGQGHKDYSRGGTRQQYYHSNSYHGNNSQQAYQNQGRNQNQGNNVNFNNSNQQPSRKSNQSNRLSEEKEDSSLPGFGSMSANQKANKTGVTNQNEVKTQPTCVVTPFVPLQVVKKQTPQKQRRESSSEDTGAKPAQENSPDKGETKTVSDRVPSAVNEAQKLDNVNMPSKVIKVAKPDRANIPGKTTEAQKINTDKSGDVNTGVPSDSKTPVKEKAGNTSARTPAKSAEKLSAPPSGKKSKRRLAANFNFN